MKKYKFIGNEGYSNNLGGNYFTHGQITDYEPLIKRFPEFFEEVIEVENITEDLDDTTENLNETKDDENSDSKKDDDNSDDTTENLDNDSQLNETRADEPITKEVVDKIMKPKANKSNKNKK